MVASFFFTTKRSIINQHLVTNHAHLCRCLTKNLLSAAIKYGNPSSQPLRIPRFYEASLWIQSFKTCSIAVLSLECPRAPVKNKGGAFLAKHYACLTNTLTQIFGINRTAPNSISDFLDRQSARQMLARDVLRTYHATRQRARAQDRALILTFAITFLK